MACCWACCCGLLRTQTLLGCLHVFQLLADLGQARLEFVHRVVQRLDLARELVDLSSTIGLLLLQRLPATH